MKWYFCWCQETEFRTDHNWEELIKISVESALINTNLEPHFIYDGNPSNLTEYLENKGVIIHYHRISFEKEINEFTTDSQSRSVARGAFLRFDIPLIEKDDKYVLYTDADVIFLPGKDIFKGYYPDFLAAAPQFDRGSIRDMNSGVMIINVDSWKEKRDELINFTLNNLHVGLDQEILREYLGKDYLLLPDRFNWKPYWGLNPDAAIIHWHGPKPVTINHWLNDKDLNIPHSWRILLEQGESSYKEYIKQHDFFLNFIEQKRDISPVEIEINNLNNGFLSGEIKNIEHPDSPICIKLKTNSGEEIYYEFDEIKRKIDNLSIFNFNIPFEFSRGTTLLLAEDLALREVLFNFGEKRFRYIKLS